MRLKGKSGYVKMGWIVLAASASVLWCAPEEDKRAPAASAQPEFTEEFFIDECSFVSRGRNPYFILEPRYRLTLEGDDDGEFVEVAITVLRQTKNVAGVETRVVEEREKVDGELVEVSRNYFAICAETGSVFYFGEDVDIYEDGVVVSHDGAWRAGVNGARPGMIMPGDYLLGARYFQEMAPGVALDRALHTAMGLEISTTAGDFSDCVEIIETSPLEPGHESLKIYCRGVGLVKDGAAELADWSGSGH